MHRTIISFVQPQSNSIQNKNNPIGCGTAPGNLVMIINHNVIHFYSNIGITTNAFKVVVQTLSFILFSLNRYDKVNSNSTIECLGGFEEKN